MSIESHTMTDCTAMTEYRAGDTFVNETGNIHILSRVTAIEMCLISLQGGNRWNNPVIVMGTHPSVAAWGSITEGEEFTKVDVAVEIRND